MPVGQIMYHQLYFVDLSRGIIAIYDRGRISHFSSTSSKPLHRCLVGVDDISALVKPLHSALLRELWMNKALHHIISKVHHILWLTIH